jgi:hydroxymethylglutaryl-CoA reductase
MGANLVNSLCEQLADDVAARAGGEVGLRILSNLSDQRTVRVTGRVPHADLGDERAAGPEVSAAIARASRFAEQDPYRAVTHNKGIMNGVDAVLVATGQDWRAVEAGAHAYAARTGAYRPLATWREDGDALVGTLELPLAVGTVGGALRVHRGAALAVRLAGALGVPSARSGRDLGLDGGADPADPAGPRSLDAARAMPAARLAAIAAAAGLACNLAALRALATDGIQRGHMTLHARAIARAAGVPDHLIATVAAELAAAGDVRIEAVRGIMERLSSTAAATSSAGRNPP